MSIFKLGDKNYNNQHIKTKFIIKDKILEINLKNGGILEKVGSQIGLGMKLSCKSAIGRILSNTEEIRNKGCILVDDGLGNKQSHDGIMEKSNLKDITFEKSKLNINLNIISF